MARCCRYEMDPLGPDRPAEAVDADEGEGSPGPELREALERLQPGEYLITREWGGAEDEDEDEWRRLWVR